MMVPDIDFLDGVDLGALEGAAYPAAAPGAPIVKPSRLEALLAAPVQLPGQKQRKKKNKKHKTDRAAAAGNGTPEATEQDPGHPHALASPAPDLSSLRLPAAKRTVSFAVDVHGADSGPGHDKAQDAATRTLTTTHEARQGMQQPGCSDRDSSSAQVAGKVRRQNGRAMTSGETALDGGAGAPPQPRAASINNPQSTTQRKGKTENREQKPTRGAGTPQPLAHPHQGSRVTAGSVQEPTPTGTGTDRNTSVQQPVPEQRGKKRARAEDRAANGASTTPSTAPGRDTAQAPAPSGLLDKMRAKLSGSRFRALNEQMYTCSGDDALRLMQSDPALFEQYHTGFQEQTKGWPQQPLELAAKWLAARPPELVVADIGCGVGRLATLVKQKVHSFDLVAAAPHVIACNMASLPLPPASVDVAVFSLALMGTDYGAFLAEAARVLRHKGWLWIAEVRSRFAGDDAGKQAAEQELKPFLHSLAKLGFQLMTLDCRSNTMFFVAVLRKVNMAAAPDRIAWPSLRACVYKKR